MSFRSSLSKQKPYALPEIQALEARSLLSGVVFAVNAGGDDFVDADGQAFMSDRDFTGGSAQSNAKPVTNPADDLAGAVGPQVRKGVNMQARRERAASGADEDQSPGLTARITCQHGNLAEVGNGESVELARAIERYVPHIPSDV